MVFRSFKFDTVIYKAVFKKASIFIIGAFFLLLAHVSAKVDLHKNGSGDGKKFIAPPSGIEHFVFGYNEVIADLLWVRSLQDIDTCEKRIDEINCIGNSWMFRMIDAITNLSPHFRMPYAVGSLSLTVLVNDIKGASIIFDKAVKAFPNDWPILYRASYQALIEEKNNEKAAGLMLRAAQNGAPEWLYEASARLYSEEGKMAVAEGILADLKANNENEELIRNMEKKIEDLRKKQAK